MLVRTALAKLCALGRCENVYLLTGTLDVVRMTASSVGEKIRLAAAFAALYFASTRTGKASVRPSSILRVRLMADANKKKRLIAFNGELLYE